MKQFALVFLCFVTFFVSGCSTNTGIGVLSGGGLGAGIGVVLGGGGGGALIGSAAGLITGGLIGAVLDEQDRKVVSKTSPRTIDRMDRGEPLTLNDVIKLSQSGVSDEAIISYLVETHSIYDLSRTQIRRLQSSGVSERVIQFMMDETKSMLPKK